MSKAFMRIARVVVSMGSNVRCKVCGGWGGEWGQAKGVGAMCYDCYKKKHGVTSMQF